MGLYAVKQGKNYLYAVCLLLAGVALVVYSDIARTGVYHGLALCAQVVIPALFAFMCLCEWVTLSGASAFLTRLLRPVYRFLMGPAWQGGTALLMCLLGGYSMGAAALVGLHRQDLIHTKQLSGLSLLIFTPSPAFVITGVGTGMLGSAKAGLLLWTACTLSTLLLTAVGCRFFTRFQNTAVPMAIDRMALGDSFVEAVAAACRKLLNICGLVVLFRAVGDWLTVLPISANLAGLLMAAGEVTNGCTALKQAGLPLIAAVITFGGVCTHMQIKGILGKAMPRYRLYLPVRLFHSAVSYAVAWGLCRLFPDALSTMAAGGVPLPGEVSLLPSTALLVTCIVFLSSLNIGLEKRRKPYEESGLYLS